VPPPRAPPLSKVGGARAPPGYMAPAPLSVTLKFSLHWCNMLRSC